MFQNSVAFRKAFLCVGLFNCCVSLTLVLFGFRTSTRSATEVRSSISARLTITPTSSRQTVDDKNRKRFCLINRRTVSSIVYHAASVVLYASTLLGYCLPLTNDNTKFRCKLANLTDRGTCRFGVQFSVVCEAKFT